MSRLRAFARGVRVLDLSSFLPGPLATLLLADMGAEVLKVEAPAGDAMLAVGPRDADGRGVLHEAVNAGKSLLRLDLKQAGPRAAFLGLVAEYDVLVEGFRPGVMARLGLDYATLRAVNPGLIYCSLSGYGAEGPLAQTAGHDDNYLASAGVLYRNAGFQDPPFADVSGSLFGVIAILGALRAREADGLGCAIDIALADVAMPLQLFALAEMGATGAAPQLGAETLNGGAAYYQVYRTRDGRQVALGAIEAKFWAAFCTAAGRPDWVARRDEALPQHGLIAEVAGVIGGMDSDACVRRFGPADCCLTLVLDLGEAVESAHHRSRGMVQRTADGALQALFPARVDGVGPAPRTRLKG